MTAAELKQRGQKDKKEYLYETNRTKAKALLKEAGYPNGLTLEFFQTERGEYMIPMQNIQAQLREAGITLKFIMVDHTTWHQKIRANECSLVLYNSIRPNTDVRFTHYDYSESIVVTGKAPITNFSHVGAVDADGSGKISTIDDLIDAARNELDPKRQNENLEGGVAQASRLDVLLSDVRQEVDLCQTEQHELGVSAFHGHSELSRHRRARLHRRLRQSPPERRHGRLPCLLSVSAEE